MSAAEIVAARNSLKAYFRGRPLDTWLPGVSPRYGYPSFEKLVERNAGNVPRVIERSGVTSFGWTAALVGGGAAKAGQSAAEAMRDECGCSQ